MKYAETIQQMNYDYSSFQLKIEALDADAVREHNLRFPPSSPYHLSAHLRPCPFEGDLRTAKVVLLLANPHADATTVEEDHMQRDGWGVWGLSNEASEGLRSWWRPRLRQFIKDATDETEWQALSRKFASFQAVAWASEQFHDANSLPSKQLMRETLHSLVTNYPQKIFVVMRQRKYWDSVLRACNAQHVIYSRSSRCSFISKGNIDTEANWQMLCNCITN